MSFCNLVVVAEAILNFDQINEALAELIKVCNKPYLGSGMRSPQQICNETTLMKVK